jgi:hypothetical protein
MSGILARSGILTQARKVLYIYMAILRMDHQLPFGAATGSLGHPSSTS